MKQNILTCIKRYLQGQKNNSSDSGGYTTNIINKINEMYVGANVTDEVLQEICAAEDNNFEYSKTTNGRRIIKFIGDGNKRKVEYYDGRHKKKKVVKVSIMSFFFSGVSETFLTGT